MSSKSSLPPVREMQPVIARITECLARAVAFREAPGSCEDDESWNELEWKLAPMIASAQGILSLLASAKVWRSAPASWQSFLDKQVDLTYQRNLRLLDYLRRLLELAQARGLRTLPLKGMDLLTSLYAGDAIALRPTSDIDLLVHEDELGAWHELAAQASFVPRFNTSRHDIFVVPPNRVVTLVGEHPDNPIKLELHVRCADNIAESLCDVTNILWRHAKTQGRDGAPALYPSLAALMLCLLVHFSGHMLRRSARFVQLRDIFLVASAMLETDRTELCILLDEVEGWWWAYPPLALAQHYFHDAIPSDWVARARAAAPRWMRRQAAQLTITRVSCCALAANPIWHQLIWARSISLGLRNCLALAFPSRRTLEDWEMVQQRPNKWLAARGAHTRQVLRRLSPNTYRDVAQRMLTIVLGDNL